MDALLYKYLVLVCLGVGASGKITWDSTWINNNQPYVNGTEIEPPPNATYLSSVCPAGSGGRLAVRCQDRKGEPFTLFQNNTALHFVATCIPVMGILCNPYVGYNSTCPDLQMNFGCDVPDPTTTTGVPGKSSLVSQSPTNTSPTISQKGTSPSKVAQGTSFAKSSPGTTVPKSTRKGTSGSNSSSVKDQQGTSPSKGPVGTNPVKSPKHSSPASSHQVTSKLVNNRIPVHTTSHYKPNKGKGNRGTSINYSRSLLVLAIVIFIGCFRSK